MKRKRGIPAEIFKLQRPIAGGYGQVFFYNEDRSEIGEFPMGKDVKKLFGKEYKIYVAAAMVKDNLQIYKKVEEQDW